MTPVQNSIKRIFRNANKVLKAECHYTGGHIAYVPLTPDEVRTMAVTNPTRLIDE